MDYTDIEQRILAEEHQGLQREIARPHLQLAVHGVCPPVDPVILFHRSMSARRFRFRTLYTGRTATARPNS